MKSVVYWSIIEWSCLRPPNFPLYYSKVLLGVWMVCFDLGQIHCLLFPNRVSTFSSMADYPSLVPPFSPLLLSLTLDLLDSGLSNFVCMYVCLCMSGWVEEVYTQTSHQSLIHRGVWLYVMLAGGHMGWTGRHFVWSHNSTGSNVWSPCLNKSGREGPVARQPRCGCRHVLVHRGN